MQLWKKQEFIERIEEIHKVAKEADLITHNIQSLSWDQHDRASEHQANLTEFFIKTHYILHQRNCDSFFCLPHSKGGKHNPADKSLFSGQVLGKPVQYPMQSDFSGWIALSNVLTAVTNVYQL